MSTAMPKYPIRLSQDRRSFVDADGTPFFWLGDTAWPLIARYTRKEAETYLENRAQKGFNVIQCVIAWGGGTGFEGNTPGSNQAGEFPWLGNDPARPNPAYFAYIDVLLDFAAARGMTLAMLPTWGYYVNEAKLLNPQNARIYGRWLGERYHDRPNIVWVNGGDRIPTHCEDTYRALAVGLHEGDLGRHLVTYHPCGWRSSSQFWHSEDWLDFNMIETWTEWTKVYPAVTTDALMLPTKPVVLGEGAYEDGPEYPLGPITPLIVRRQAWWSFMAGGYFTYGQNQMWRMDAGWLDTLDSPGAAQMTVFKSIANSRPWWQTVPDQGLFSSGVSSDRTLNAGRRAVDGSFAMLYLSSQCHVLVNLERILTRQVKATWVNPQNGEKLDAGIFSTGNAIEGRVFPEWKSQWFSVPNFWEDAVLLLDGQE